MLHSHPAHFCHFSADFRGFPAAPCSMDATRRHPKKRLSHIPDMSRAGLTSLRRCGPRALRAKSILMAEPDADAEPRNAKSADPVLTFRSPDKLTRRIEAYAAGHPRSHTVLQLIVMGLRAERRYDGPLGVRK